MDKVKTVLAVIRYFAGTGTDLSGLGKITGVFAAYPSAKAKWSSEVRIIESGRHWSGPWCDCDGSVVLSDRTSNRTGF